MVSYDVLHHSAHVIPSKNEKRSAWTCKVSGVKFNDGSTSTVPDGDRVTALHTIAKIYAIDRDIELKHETLPALRPRAVA